MEQDTRPNPVVSVMEQYTRPKPVAVVMEQDTRPNPVTPAKAGVSQFDG